MNCHSGVDLPCNRMIHSGVLACNSFNEQVSVNT